LSLRKLAKELDVDPGTLARWEKGQSYPKPAFKLRLEGTFNQRFSK
jgi:transcriptional regulator with XRE-family HTH domain